MIEFWKETLKNSEVLNFLRLILWEKNTKKNFIKLNKALHKYFQNKGRYIIVYVK